LHAMQALSQLSYTPTGFADRPLAIFIAQCISASLKL
jgi:hypothetical protein